MEEARLENDKLQADLQILQGQMEVSTPILVMYDFYGVLTTMKACSLLLELWLWACLQIKGAAIRLVGV